MLLHREATTPFTNLKLGGKGGKVLEREEFLCRHFSRRRSENPIAYLIPKRSLDLLHAPWLFRERATSACFGALSRYCPEIKENHALGQKAILECVLPLGLRACGTSPPIHETGDLAAQAGEIPPKISSRPSLFPGMKLPLF